MDFGMLIAVIIIKATLMNINKEYLSIIITFPKPIIERDDGQNINSCVATHSEKTRVA
jgi:hypothetical protein